ncbi:hypothetical protein TELCIR_00422 [Teladorsagia circumcincta]|uniref:G-protein coupled receptors family 1 profile domain-containing protein n=1 Tax=Teladorsagia circumcincta TaxID=45464 RepID=A0A2G9V4Q3_TELCI|nr:hypothetical protein TELCIR_00422 [Teladorsagia circumcincta]
MTNRPVLCKLKSAHPHLILYDQGYLMSILCFLQIVCLISELGNLRVYWSRMAVDQAVCFRMIAVYLFSFIAQSVMYFMLSLDMLIAVVAPLKHKMWPTKPYIFLMCLPPALVAASAFVASYYRDSNPKVTCRPPTAVVHHVVVAYTIIVMVINTAAIAMILSLAFLVNKKGKEMRSSRHQGSRGEDSDTVSVTSRNRMIRVLTIVVGVFVCSSYLCVVSVHIALQMELEEDYHDYIMTFNSVIKF